MIPVIDLFAGPGGLGEGFSSVYNLNKRVFDIKLSIEKEENAHQTLELRSFFRSFDKAEVPEEYYKVLEETNLKKKKELKLALFDKYPKEYQKAKLEAWNAELGGKDFPSELIDERIKKALGKSRKWVLIGGPPCQAYSIVGRARVGGIDNEDHRVYLYKEYLRIIAVHHPSVFVMENVEGLLSAKVNGEKVFSWILRDLQNPSLVFKSISSPKYKIYSLTTEPESYDLFNVPSYLDHRDYLIKSEKYGVPQKRHRVILLGIREDINSTPSILKIQNKELELINIIGDLPKIRSGLSRSFISSIIIEGKKKRAYIREKNSDENWEQIVNSFREEIISWNGFAKNYPRKKIRVPKKGIGSEFITCNTPSKRNPLFFWYFDPKLNGVCNHESRSHLIQDLKRYMFSSMFAKTNNRFPKLHEYNRYSRMLLPDHKNVSSGKFSDRFRVQLCNKPATTITCHISKDGHYFIHYDPDQCRSLTVREAARIQTFPDNYLFCGPRTFQFHQVGNAVPPYLAYQVADIVKGILY
jgi:DNA (cytosine-5)-methyltransferase 1